MLSDICAMSAEMLDNMADDIGHIGHIGDHDARPL